MGHRQSRWLSNPLGVFERAGYRMVWVEDFDDGLWVVEEAKVVLADRSLPVRAVADALWLEFVERLSS